MNLPNKIKHFAWKACNEILPTKESLFRRKITDNNTCEGCGSQVETTMHMLCFCKHGTEVWSSCKIALPCGVKEEWSFVDTWSKLRTCWEASPELLEKWITICWGIWKSRNEVRHGGKRRPGQVVVRSSLRLLADFQAANERPSKQETENQPMATWLPPPQGSFKVNVDGALFSKTKQAGVGVMVRDEQGNVIAAMSRKLDFPLGALETEAKALEIGVNFAKEVGLRDVVFEGDSLMVINAVHSSGDAAASVQNIIHSVLRNVQCFTTFDFLHTKRQGNAPAHLLAQHAKYVENVIVWLEECPSLVAHACAHDVSGFQFSERSQVFPIKKKKKL